MNVLAVDDQINVLNGLMVGVQWKKLGIDQVYKAGNAAEAKRILRACTVDILLSDIEMPGESGLQLSDGACGFWLCKNSYEAGQCGLYPSASLLHTDRGIDPKSN